MKKKIFILFFWIIYIIKLIIIKLKPPQKCEKIFLVGYTSFCVLEKF